jgi:Uma2 family endonuclease
MEITKKILKSPKLPLYFQKISDFYENEKKCRLEFYNKITPDDKAEFINGKIIMQSPATNKHLLISNLLSKILNFYVDEFDLGQIYVEKALISLKRNDYEPDICFFKKERTTNFNTNTLLFPAPDLVIEILSKTTQKTDRGIKFEDYAFNQIREYWLIDPENETIEQYILFDEKYELIKKTNEGTIKTEQIKGLELPVKAIFSKEENQKFLKNIFNK